MTKYILALFTCLLSSISLFAQVDYEDPQIYTIAGIEVVGCEYTIKKSVLEKTGLAIGDDIAIPGPEISNAIKRLWDQALFADIHIDIDNIVGDKVFLTIFVTERSRIARYNFPGLGKSEESDLREKIDLVRGTKWTEEKKRRTERIIRNFYVEKGFLNTKVNFLEDPDESLLGGVWIRILVDKGSRVKINEIKIAGNQDFSDKRLKVKLKEIKEKRWWRLWKRSKYQSSKMDVAKANLIDYLRENGYRDAEIVFDTITPYDEKSIDVEIEIFEGNQYYIRDIEFSGNFKYSADSLKGLLGIEKGDIYNSTLLDSRLHGDVTGRDVSSLYLDDGYLFFRADPIETRVEGDSVDLEIRLFEGPQATIRKVIVEGNTKTSDYVILRELRTLPGQKFSRSDLIRSQREILNLGYFNQENLQVIPIPDPAKGTVDIKYIVEEKPSDQLQVQGGWGGRVRDTQGNVIGGGFVGTVQLGFNNFSTKKFFKKGAWRPIPAGDGQKLNLAVQMNGVGWQNYSISFLEPWLGGKKPNSLGVRFYYTINQNPRTDFRMGTFGTSIDFGTRLKWPDDFFRSYSSLNYKYYDIRNGGAAFTSLGDFDTGYINIISFRQTIDRTSIDAPIYPRSGSQVTFSVEATPPWSLIQGRDITQESDAQRYNLLEYHKWSFTAQWYFQIVKNLVIRPKVQYGFLGSYSKDYGISPFERYYLGGSGLGQFNFYGWEYIGLRGYPDNSIGPRPETSPGATPLGGNIMNKYMLELRYPLTLNQAAPIWVVGFLEGGNTWLGFEKYNPFDLKRSAGVGIRVVLPMVGMLGVDWGYGFDRVSTVSPINGSQITFIIGQEF